MNVDNYSQFCGDWVSEDARINSGYIYRVIKILSSSNFQIKFHMHRCSLWKNLFWTWSAVQQQRIIGAFIINFSFDYHNKWWTQLSHRACINFPRCRIYDAVIRIESRPNASKKNRKEKGGGIRKWIVRSFDVYKQSFRGVYRNEFQRHIYISKLQVNAWTSHKYE